MWRSANTALLFYIGICEGENVFSSNQKPFLFLLSSVLLSSVNCVSHNISISIVKDDKGYDQAPLKLSKFQTKIHTIPKPVNQSTILSNAAQKGVLRTASSKGI